MSRFSLRGYITGFIILAVATSNAWLVAEDILAPKTYQISPHRDVQYEFQDRLINAVPGDVIELAAGTYHFHAEINISCDNITIRGAGRDQTVISFANQTVGSEGIVATGNAFAIENLAVVDSVGNAIKVLGSNGVVFRNVRAEWTRGPHSENGAYGLYPVQCENVLIENCVAIGASDAGIYVGQSKNVIVRESRAEKNVAGIEIENTIGADVFNNVAIHNTGGILIFDLPGLQVSNGSQVRVFNNRIVDNNLENFAPVGNIVATVPAGTGLMIMATDDVQVSGNLIENNQTLGIGILSYLITQRPINDANYDPIPEGIWIHDNALKRNGHTPSGEFGKTFAAVIGSPFPQLIYDGVTNPKRAKNGQIPAEYQVNISNQPSATFANLRLRDMTPEKILKGEYQVDTNIVAYAGTQKPLKKIELPDFPAAKSSATPAVVVYRNAPRKLSEWNLFRGEIRHQTPEKDVLYYDLNTPLFSDYSKKRRFIRLPDGQKMTYREKQVFDFPVGTVIVKTFSYPHDMRDLSKGEQLIETRIEERKDSGWYGYTYEWNDDQTDATMNLGGGVAEVSWIHSDGMRRSGRYHFPNVNQCITCHSENGKFVPLGPTARNLNRANQIENWHAAGFIEHLTSNEQIPKMATFDAPETGSLNDRARAWLDVNCAHCHNETGSARTTGLDLSIFQEDPAKFGVLKSPVATGRGSGGRKYDIVPGKPDESILMYRLESAEPGVRMPNLARSIHHVESSDLIWQWISDLKPID